MKSIEEKGAILGDNLRVKEEREMLKSGWLNFEWDVIVGVQGGLNEM